jgi:hypothetical protein
MDKRQTIGIAGSGGAGYLPLSWRRCGRLGSSQYGCAIAFQRDRAGYALTDLGEMTLLDRVTWLQAIPAAMLEPLWRAISPTSSSTPRRFSSSFGRR